MQTQELFSVVAARLAACAPVQARRKAVGTTAPSLDPGRFCHFECWCPWQPPCFHGPDGVSVREEAPSVPLLP